MITWVVFFCVSCSVYAQSADEKLINDVDFKLLLTQTQKLLPVLETEFNGIDLDKNPSIAYSTGKFIADQRQIALTEIRNTQVFVAKLRTKRTVYDELALKEFLDSLFDAGEEIVWQEDFAHLSLTHLEKHAPELSAIILRIANDVHARIQLLETDPCHK
ncbi:MAG: hypothetical protein WA172_07170 [Terriglobales bacterium]